MTRLGTVGMLVTCVVAAGCTGGNSGAAAEHGPQGDGAFSAAGDATGQGIGDPYYPDDGNLGYDVARYDVRLTYDPAEKFIDADTTVTGHFTDAMNTMHFDLLGLDVSRVE